MNDYVEATFQCIWILVQIILWYAFLSFITHHFRLFLIYIGYITEDVDSPVTHSMAVAMPFLWLPWIIFTFCFWILALPFILIHGFLIRYFSLGNIWNRIDTAITTGPERVYKARQLGKPMYHKEVDKGKTYPIPHGD